MDPFAILVTLTRIGLLACLAGLLAWAAYQRAVVHRIWRLRVRDTHTNVSTFPGWVAAGTVAGLV